MIVSKHQDQGYKDYNTGIKEQHEYDSSTRVMISISRNIVG